MRTRLLRILSGGIAIGLITVGCVPKYIPDRDEQAQEDKAKPLVERAQRVIDQLKGQYVFASALLDAAQADLVIFRNPPDGVRAKHLKLKALRSAARECWDEPVISTGASVLESFELIRLSNAFDQKRQRHLLPAVEKKIGRLVDDFPPCSGRTVDKARNLPRKTTEEARVFVENTLLRIHRARVIANEAPGYWERVNTDLNEARSQISMLRTKIKVEGKKPDANKALIEDHLRWMDKVLSQDLPSIGNAVQSASENMETELILLMEQFETVLDNRPFLGISR